MNDGGSRAPLITTFRNRGWALKLYMIFGVGVIVQGIATLLYFMRFADAPDGLKAVMVGLAALILFGAGFASQALQRIRDPEAPITIGPAGLHDRALTLQPIPWKDIRDMRVLSGSRSGRTIVFDMDEDAATRAAVRPRVRAAANVNRAFGYSYRVHHMGTTANVDRLIAAMSSYADVRQ